MDWLGWGTLVSAVCPGNTITAGHLYRIGRNLVERLPAIKRLIERVVGIVALDAGIGTSVANPAAHLRIAIMLDFADWECQMVR